MSVGRAPDGTGSPSLPGTLAGFAAAAQATADPAAWDYYEGGAGDEVTLRENVAAWQRRTLRQRILVDVSVRNTGVTLLGKLRPTPYVVAPMAFQSVLHPGGEAETAAGAAVSAAPYCLSTLATCSVPDLAASVPGAAHWFQLYVFRDRGLAAAMAEEAAAAGYEAVVVTADLPVLAMRDRDRRSGFTLPSDGGGTTGVPNAARGGAHGALTPADLAGLIDPSLTWRDLEAFVARSPVPVLLKGVQDPDDALRALDAGVAGVWVSNHGGRQLDPTMATADALAAVADVVRPTGADVIVDGGIRRGSSALAALALGANAVAVGRAVAWGLAVAGAEGVAVVLEILRAEFDVALALTGIASAGDVDSRALAD